MRFIIFSVILVILIITSNLGTFHYMLKINLNVFLSNLFFFTKKIVIGENSTNGTVTLSEILLKSKRGCVIQFPGDCCWSQSGRWKCCYNGNSQDARDCMDS